MSPQEIIDQEPMSRMQILAVILCIFIFALDGFDVLAISFAAPGIASEWNVDRAALGVILAMELIGMGVGSVVLGNLADRIGRRPVSLMCLCIMSLGMFLAGIANDVTTLSAYRLFTGFGIGGMLATANAMVAEYSNVRRRNLAVICLGTSVSEISVKLCKRCLFSAISCKTVASSILSKSSSTTETAGPPQRHLSARPLRPCAGIEPFNELSDIDARQQ